MQGKDRAGNGRKAHLGDVPGSHAQSVQRLRCVEIQHIPKILILKVIRRVEAAAHQQHISNAVLHRPAVFHLQVQLIQFFQKAAFRKGFQFGKIVGHIVLYGVLCRREQGFAQILLILQLPKAVFQRFNDVRRVFLPHRPKGDGPWEPGLMGIGNIKVVFQPGLAISRLNQSSCVSSFTGGKDAIFITSSFHGGGLPLPGNGKPVDFGDVVAQPAGHSCNIGAGCNAAI